MALLNEIGAGLGNLGIARQVGRLFFPRQYKLGDIEIDTNLNESHSATAQVTQYPVETGGNMADHIVIDPITLNINGAVSDIASNEFLDYGLVGLGKEIVNFLPGGDSLTRSQTAWAQLRLAQTNRELLTVQTGLMVYQNMYIVALTSTQDKDTSQMLTFQATLQEVLSIEFDTRADATTTSVDNPVTETAKNNGTTDSQMKKPVDLGAKNPETTSSRTSSGSILYNAILG